MNAPVDSIVQALTQLAQAEDSNAAFRELDSLCAAAGESISPYRELVRALLSRAGEVERLRNAADRDALTGVGNRRGLEAAAVRELARARRSGEPLAVLVLDLDGLKAINDEHGHEAGDRAIVELAQAGSEELRDTDYLARQGGDEFVILLPGTDVTGARRVASRIRRSIAERAFPYGVLGTSVGCAAWRPGASFPEMLREADAALYRDKRSRKETDAWDNTDAAEVARRKQHAA
ncbi:MAG: diguanylate cyclase (GGDEF)-like protein [Polyangiales bacterium]|jgi:diguanylate cyclase (GGDEF)-like protein